MIKAYRILERSDGQSYFEAGSIKEGQHFQVQDMFFQVHIDAFEERQHQAPRIQYVLTLKGVLEFTTGDGKSFTLQPGDVLIAKDVSGGGHSWKLIDGAEWIRSYVSIAADEDDGFVAD